MGSIAKLNGCRQMRQQDQNIPAAATKRQRKALRAMGLRRIEIWVPDVTQPGFAEECRRQSALVAAADAADPELMDFLDLAWADLVAMDE